MNESPPVRLKDWNDAIRTGRSALSMIDAAWARARPQPKTPKPSPFKPLGAFCAEYEPLAYAIEPIIASRSVYTLTAKTGHGKTGLMVAASFAVAMGRESILNRPVQLGRVAYVAAENPVDVRMRMMMTAYRHGIALADVADRIVVLDQRMKPEEIRDWLAHDAKERGPFRLVVADTLAALFDGKEINDNVAVGRFIHRLRDLTDVPGSPSALIAAHPVKGAGREQLVPYGAGAALNEVDGNLCLWMDNGVAQLSWQGKFRGPDFEPIPFRFELLQSPDVLDVKGRQVQIPVCVPADPEAVETKAAEIGERQLAVLRAMDERPEIGQRELAAMCGLSGTGAVAKAIKALAKLHLVEKGADERWRLTSKGKRELTAGGNASASPVVSTVHRVHDP